MGRSPSGPSAVFGFGSRLGPTVRFRLVAALAAGAALVAACGGSQGPGPVTDRVDLTGARDRVVEITTTACGYAPPSEGFGIILSPGRILTVAHVIAGATDIAVSAGDRGDVPATVIAYDRARDLALLEVTPAANPDGAERLHVDRLHLDRPALRFVVLAKGDDGVIVGPDDGEADLLFSVAEKTIIEIDEVRGTERTRRSGYRLDVGTGPGDSGRGLYDADGRLAGVLFAVSTDDRTRSWAVAADEVEAFLADRSVTGSFSCDADHSRLEPDPGR